MKLMGNEENVTQLKLQLRKLLNHRDGRDLRTVSVKTVLILTNTPVFRDLYCLLEDTVLTEHKLFLHCFAYCKTVS